MSRYKILLGETKPELPKIETFGFEKNIKNSIKYLCLKKDETGLFSLIPRRDRVTFVKQRVHWSYVLKKYIICDPSRSCCCFYPFKEGSITKSKDRIACCVFCEISKTLETGLYTWLFSDSIIEFYLETDNNLKSFFISRDPYMNYRINFVPKQSMSVTPDLQKMTESILDTVKLGIVLSNNKLINIHGRNAEACPINMI